MNKKISIGIAASIVLIAVTITFTATMIFAMNQFDSKVISSVRYGGIFDNMAEIDSIVKQYYYRDVEDDVLFSNAVDGYMDGLGDPFSVYLTADELAMRAQQASGTVVGVGLEVTQNNDGYLYVNNVYSDSPASSGGIETGDILIKINDSNVREVGYEAAERLLYGVEGTSARIEYQRDNVSNTVELTYTTMQINAVTAAQIAESYYIRVKSMNEATPQQFIVALRDAAASFSAGDVRGLIIDMRDLNGGYDRTIAGEMLTELMPRGTLFYGSYKDGTNKVLETSSNDNPVDIPMIVLINERTSGYAELVAAVLSEKANCRLVGTASFGRGTLEELHMLPYDGSAVSLSVAVLRTPSGTEFNATGVSPDFMVNTPDGFVLPAEPSGTNDSQFRKAQEVLLTL